MSSQKILALILRIERITADERKRLGSQLRIFKKLLCCTNIEMGKWEIFKGVFTSVCSNNENVYLSQKQISRLLCGKESISTLTITKILLALGVVEFEDFLEQDEGGLASFRGLVAAYWSERQRYQGALHGSD
jgi:hypothetical protein